jgi:branched-chain amino acid transport system permease protein
MAEDRIRSPRFWISALLLVLLGAVPLITALLSQPYYVTFFSRILVFALAATGLNLVLGYGGLISFGHAMYLGIGAYSVGILSAHGVTSGWAHLGAALGAGLACALATGLVCLRTRGMAFIMITLAIAQMFYIGVMSLKVYGGDDGLPVSRRSDFGWLDLSNSTVLYYVIYGLLLATLYFLWRLVHSRFGAVLRGCKSNERRMIALGFPTLRYKLAAYVISALICVLAGFLLANLARFASPSYMQWIVSGELMVMVILGGVGTLMGPLVGTSALLVLEELLSSFPLSLPWGADATIRAHWLAVVGLLIVVATRTMKHGLYGSLRGGTSKS